MKYFFVILAFFLIFIPSVALAIPIGVGYGGHTLVSLPCTCIPGSVRVQFDVMYPLQYPFVFRALLLLPATIRFSHAQFLIIPPPTAWQLGKFIPTPALPCLGVPPFCTPPFSDGTILYAGSSFPGHVLP